MLLQNEKKILDLCQRAMNEADANTLLEIFLALDEAVRLETARGRILSGEPPIEADRGRKCIREQSVAVEA